MKLRFKIPDTLKNWADRTLWYNKTLEKEIDILLQENEKLRYRIKKKLEAENKKFKNNNKNLQRENNTLNILLKDIYKDIKNSKPIVKKVPVIKEKIVYKKISYYKNENIENLNDKQEQTLIKNVIKKLEQKLDIKG